MLYHDFNASARLVLVTNTEGEWLYAPWPGAVGPIMQSTTDRALRLGHRAATELMRAHGAVIDTQPRDWARRMGGRE